MRTILETYFEQMLCCPLCKDSLELSADTYMCYSCGTRYKKDGGISDFRLFAPEYARSSVQEEWVKGQKGFEQYADNVALQDSVEFYKAEIDSVTEIYTKEFPQFYGTLLDVGGNRGTLRQFLSSDVKYLVIDPQLNAFDGIESQPGLMQVYQFLSQPCNFIAGFAEHLPLVSRQFDFVHMRSVIDHFFDPQLAIKEAFRVLKDEGKLMIGSSAYLPETKEYSIGSKLIKKWKTAKLVYQNEGFNGLMARIKYRMTSQPDHHMWKWKKEDLIDLVEKSGFVVDKLVQQKPPFEYCFYMLCSKILKKTS